MSNFSHSLVRQIAWAAILAAGFGVLWLLIALLLGQLIPELWQGGKRPPYESIIVRADGSLLIQSIPLENMSLISYRDLKGQAQDAPARDDQLPAVHLSGEDHTPGFPFSRMGWNERLAAFVNDREPTINWFWIRDTKPEGAGYFVGYERITNRRVGFIGMSGFRTDPAPTADLIPVHGSPTSSIPFSIHAGHDWLLQLDRWDVPPRWVFVPSEHVLRKVDLDERTIETFLETRENLLEAGVPTITSWSAGHATREQPILARTTGQIYKLDHQHRITLDFAIPTEVDRQSALQWYETNKGQSIVVFIRDRALGDPTPILTKLGVYRLTGDGAIQEQFELALQTGSRIDDVLGSDLGLAFVVPAPLILLGIDLGSLYMIPQRQRSRAAFSTLVKDLGPALLVVLVVSLVLALLAWRRSRSYGFAREHQIAWSVFVLLFGLPAYAGFLLHRRWPIRLPCPYCHANVPRDRVMCAECGASFPEPALKGIEIFA
jgi:hypothetical protein